MQNKDKIIIHSPRKMYLIYIHFMYFMSSTIRSSVLSFSQAKRPTFYRIVKK